MLLSKSSIFSLLSWSASNALLSLGKTRFGATLLVGSVHMLRTLRGWAIAALVISVALQFFRRETTTAHEPASRQIRAVFSTFSLFSALVLMFIAARNSGLAPWAATAVTLVGGAITPVVAIMALEFPDLRPRAMAAGVVVAGGLASVLLVNTLTAKPAPRPGMIRTSQPADTVEEPPHPIGPNRA